MFAEQAGPGAGRQGLGRADRAWGGQAGPWPGRQGLRRAGKDWGGQAAPGVGRQGLGPAGRAWGVTCVEVGRGTREAAGGGGSSGGLLLSGNGQGCRSVAAANLPALLLRADLMANSASHQTLQQQDANCARPPGYSNANACS